MKEHFVREHNYYLICFSVSKQKKSFNFNVIIYLKYEKTGFRTFPCTEPSVRDPDSYLTGISIQLFSKHITSFTLQNKCV